MGGEFLFTWLDESEATPDELEALDGTDEEAWIPLQAGPIELNPEEVRRDLGSAIREVTVIENPASVGVR